MEGAGKGRGFPSSIKPWPTNSFKNPFLLCSLLFLLPLTTYYLIVVSFTSLLLPLSADWYKSSWFVLYLFVYLFEYHWVGFYQNHSPSSSVGDENQVDGCRWKKHKFRERCQKTIREANIYQETIQSASSVLLLALVLLLSAVSVLLASIPWRCTPWTPWTPGPPCPAHCCSSLRIRTW